MNLHSAFKDLPNFFSAGFAMIGEEEMIIIYFSGPVPESLPAEYNGIQIIGKNIGSVKPL